MSLKTWMLGFLKRRIARSVQWWSSHPIESQHKQFEALLKKGSNTSYGKAHHFREIKTYDDFRQAVPIIDYEGLRPWIDRIIAGEHDVLWPGRPRYFAKTSGTTSGVKYIPLTTDSIPNHFGTARNALFYYFAKTGHGDWLDGKMIFLSGSPELEDVGGIPTGRLSGIVNHLVPAWLRSNQLPTYQTNCIEPWEAKLDAIVTETLHQDMRLISGIPPWVKMYYERLIERSGKKYIKDIFPNYSIFVHGGVNFEPYRQSLEGLVGKPIATLETYPASEGFIAFQDVPGQPGLLLNVNSGIFFEFVPAEEIFNEHPTRLSLEEVEMGVNYALIINSNAGLWGYNLGDTIQFVSLKPCRIVVTGRIKHFISAFGEHVIGKEVEQAMQLASARFGVRVTEFTVAPQVSPPEGGLPYHEWFVEFETMPEDLDAFAIALDQEMVQQNIYYKDLIEGHILRPLVIRPLRQNAFREYMQSIGKLGGQNKVPRLGNDRTLARALESFILTT